MVKIQHNSLRFAIIISELSLEREKLPIILSLPYHLLPPPLMDLVVPFTIMPVVVAAVPLQINPCRWHWNMVHYMEVASSSTTNTDYTYTTEEDPLLQRSELDLL